MTDTCSECSEDCGPCPAHVEILAQRDGASSRTADELAAVFVGDVEALRPDVRPYDAAMADAVDLAADYWGACPSGGWAPLPADDTYPMGEALSDAIYAGEAALVDLGLEVWWDDGYIIGRVTGGPLL